MIIGTDELKELVKKKKLVENLSERELTNPEGAGYDLRIGELYKIKGEAFLGIDERKTPEIELIAKFEEGKQVSHTIKPDEFYLGKTIESVNLPEDITVNFKPRGTTVRSGLNIRTWNAAPGYKGGIIFSIKNDGPVSVKIELGARIIHAQFFLVKGKTNTYRGQWQGGRITTEKIEKQV